MSWLYSFTKQVRFHHPNTVKPSKLVGFSRLPLQSSNHKKKIMKTLKEKVKLLNVFLFSHMDKLFSEPEIAVCKLFPFETVQNLSPNKG